MPPPWLVKQRLPCVMRGYKGILWYAWSAGRGWYPTTPGGLLHAGWTHTYHDKILVTARPWCPWCSRVTQALCPYHCLFSNWSNKRLPCVMRGHKGNLLHAWSIEDKCHSHSALTWSLPCWASVLWPIHVLISDAPTPTTHNDIKAESYWASFGPLVRRKDCRLQVVCPDPCMFTLFVTHSWYTSVKS